MPRWVVAQKVNSPAMTMKLPWARLTTPITPKIKFRLWAMST